MMNINDSIKDFSTNMKFPEMGSVVYDNIQKKLVELLHYTDEASIPIVLHSYISSVYYVGVESIIRSYVDMIIRLNKSEGKLKKTSLIDYCSNLCYGKSVRLRIGELTKMEVAIISIIYVSLTTNKEFTLEDIGEMISNI